MTMSAMSSESDRPSRSSPLSAHYQSEDLGSSSQFGNPTHLEVQKTLSYAWMLRKCDCYNEEYKSCSKLRSRFQQYYIHGEIQSCQNWKENYNDCLSWTRTGDKKFAKQIIEREKARIGQRLRDHLSNDVWELRDEPPADFNAPLPPHLADAGEESIFKAYDKGESREDYSKIVNNPINRMTTNLACSIM
ncbi:hypothetical protein TCAL_02330 [Tigriopus californicus]|uniref:Synaptic plasticity regulator PANTS n=1 Tax=Tigriopus californicus TaxID=6832 RepID=A0A553NX01_TIGCA|nr:uncharacterized protein LOC131887054 [Tigriopus californicus]TRY69966.1 hypothetical protein TCAL_02330 [Tigriopus californicus]|eukprot:TCALIF_02330-PA protein Name:"Similar to UPF0545 protein C22orf39 homolog (Danio rerio)" AED:0.02 eAED:0.02 QI:141/1/1/1/0/0/3/63/189